ncbi:hypothetical protein HUT18_19325 [Streptomyces sp. NA04227]|uniref:hypothetical protein n=1 Tax=Streptomyces sp. NA04227 TaxID=2742136 RepID=UPI0015925CC7|nr:hypothetical protein [Streptomyces sp. NA04227]QKW08209.1 hypothetical protein HUT18_19325 [Streptomyces sp. NA04227]
MTDTAEQIRRTWQAPGELHPDDRREFGAMLRYCLDGTDETRIDLDTVPRIEFGAVDAADADRVERLLGEAFKRFAGAPGQRPDRTRLDNWDLKAEPAAPTATGPLGTTPADGRIGPGLFVSGPRNALLIRSLERLLGKIAARLGADEYTVPALLPWTTLEKAGYTGNFPQHITAAGVVRPDLDALDRFGKATDVAGRAAELEYTPVALAPAVCMGLFERFQGARLTEPLTVTATGQCSRYEGKATADTSPTRRWSFSMREIVYVGDRPGARAFHGQVLAELLALAENLGLPCKVQPASDPFFTSARPQMAQYQAAMDVKYELVGRMAHDGSGVAVSSLNYHNQHFGKGFDIAFDGRPGFSVCWAFGLERWAEWLGGYLGDNPADWPVQLREQV